MTPRVRNPWHSDQVVNWVSHDEIDRLKQLFVRAAGPTPWYAKRLPPMEGPGGRKLGWEMSGPVTVVDEVDRLQKYMVLGFYCWVQVLNDSRFVVWNHLGEQRQPRAVAIRLFDSSKFQTLDRPPTYRRLSREEDPVAYSGGEVSRIELPVSWEPGSHPLDVPLEMRSLPELFLLVDWRPGRNALYVVQPTLGTVAVHPVTWWNEGEFDFGYEWITRIVRDPRSGNLVGEGIRIQPFLMSEQGEFISWIGSESMRPSWGKGLIRPPWNWYRD